MQLNRVIIVIMDSCGVGELPDAALYGDTGAATVPNVARAVGGLKMPVCEALGLGNIARIKGIPQTMAAQSAFGTMAAVSAGKDSTSGHWEIGGVILDQPLPVYPDGFPPDLVSAFEQAANIKTVGNKAASGTEIINELGKQHLETGHLILYSSADSVFQLAAHEDIHPPDRLYEYCRTARALLVGEHAVGRVIARPFEGTVGDFRRTSRRKDFSLEPAGNTILDIMDNSGLKVLSIGKICDLFAGRGIATSVKTSDNHQVMDELIKATGKDAEHDMIFANCVDFDMLWGHRNDETGFAAGLEYFDSRLGELLPNLRDDDLLLITADHGCDPTLKHSTDHTREYVPIMACGHRVKSGANLGVRSTFSDVSVTIAELFGLDHNFTGRSFLEAIRRD